MVHIFMDDDDEMMRPKTLYHVVQIKIFYRSCLNLPLFGRNMVTEITTVFCGQWVV